MAVAYATIANTGASEKSAKSSPNGSSRRESHLIIEHASVDHEQNDGWSDRRDRLGRGRATREAADARARAR